MWQGFSFTLGNENYETDLSAHISFTADYRLIDFYTARML